MRLLYRIVKSVKIYELKKISSNQFCDIKKDIKNFRPNYHHVLFVLYLL